MTDTGDTAAPAPDAGEPDPQRIAAAAAGCPSVARLHAGPATAYLPGKRIPGISITPETVTIHVDLAYPATAAALGAELRAAVVGLLAGRSLAISVEDVALPENTHGSNQSPDVVMPHAPTSDAPLSTSPGVLS